ncbi:MAG: hypothetical protein WC239_12630 [Sphaerochaetaceae bacterium]|jgi:hypothetical protein
MKKHTVDKEERQNRLLLLQDYELWRTETGSNSRMVYAQERGVSLQYLINCLKWHYEACKRKDQNIITADIGPKPKEFPTLVAVTKKDEPIKSASYVTKAAICINMRASNIEIAGDIAPALLTQLLSTLGALHVL